MGVREERNLEKTIYLARKYELKMKTNIIYLIVICLLDLLILGYTYFTNLSNFFIFILLNIIIIFILFPILIFEILSGRIMNSKEYYFKTIDTNYSNMTNDILVKMFEIRINNFRNSLFTFFALTVSFTLTILFNEKAYIFFENTPGGAKSVITISLIGVLILSYGIFSLDRTTIEEFEILFKSIEKLKQLKQ